MRIALAGNPNSGKTTMYNALTGRNEKVDNWAGVTVDKKEALIKKTCAGDQERIAVDLPGAYTPCRPSPRRRASPAPMSEMRIPMPSSTLWMPPKAGVCNTAIL